MTPIYSHAEDACTFHTLRYKLPELLEKLGDNTDPASAVVLFRPSFGRRGGAQLGEPDAMIGTDRRVYNIETKWPGSAGFDQPEFIMRPEQRRRHTALRVYREAWANTRPSGTWADVAAVANPGLAAVGAIAPMADRRLAGTLQTVLTAFERCGQPTLDVLMCVQVEGFLVTPPRTCVGFRVVCMKVPAAFGDFVRL
jgi:hypothetical protein